LGNLPRITIITPSYNQGHYIEQTITSVLDQGYPNLEYIIIDGGSTDNSVEVIKKYEKHLSFWVSEKDRGQSHAINKGFARATGEVINWLNSDDYYEKDALRKVADAFCNPDINVYCGRSRVFGQGNEYLNPGTDIYANNLYKTVGWARIDQPETFFRHTLLKQIGYVNETLHFTMDKEMWMHYLLKFGLNGICKTDELLVHYRLHDTSKTVSLQNGFIEETHNLYYTYAKWFSLEPFTALLKNLGAKEVSLSGYEQALTAEGVYKIVNYYFMQQALINYAQNNYFSAKLFMNAIDKRSLEPVDIKELKRIAQRMKVPPIIKKIIHFLR
jgi:glycosyltransferase involved in cell wall biosynthesis